MSLISFSFLLGINGQCGSGVVLMVPRGTEQGDRWGESKTDRDWERESGRDPKSSVILIPLAESCESIILHLSFILPLLPGNSGRPRPVRHLLMLSGLKGSHNSEDGTMGMQGPRGNCVRNWFLSTTTLTRRSYILKLKLRKECLAALQFCLNA